MKQHDFELWFWLAVGLAGFILGGVAAEIAGEPGRSEFISGGIVGLAVVWGAPLLWHSMDCN